MNISRPKTSAFVGYLSLLVFGFLAAATANAANFDVNVVDNDGNPVEGFRWILQEDTTYPVDPNNPPSNIDDMLSLGFHRSYHPVAQKGNTDSDSVELSVPSGNNQPERYYVSVLPYSGYSISGQSIQRNNNQVDDVTVVVQKFPIPTTTITLMLFHDNFPVNGAPDLPEETAPGNLILADGTTIDWSQFNILLEEPAGRYGAAGGQVISDVYGNPLGTSYIRGCDANGLPDFDMSTNYGCFDLDGNPILDTLGDGTLAPDADGYLTIRNIAPGKYGIIAIPPTKTGGEENGWQQTSTIEGSKVIDAWVKANEPPFFVEFGPPGPHVFIGFVKSTTDGGFAALTGGGATLSGTITDMHMSRGPNVQMYSGRPFPGCWVALNTAAGDGAGEGLWAEPCDGDSNFEINNVPPGLYQLKVFDANLDVVIATQGVEVINGVDCDPHPLTGVSQTPGCTFGEVAVFNWFSRLSTGVFSDDDQDGVWDAGEMGIGPESQDVSIRWRDGTIYQNFAMDNDGLAPFDEVFPFFHWLVGEVSFGNKKATGATFVADAGGFVDKTPPLEFPGYGELTPQPQPGLPNCSDPTAEECTIDGLSRTERGQILTAAFQGFLGQTNVMLYGKTDYINFLGTDFVGENGGISGLVYNTVTRAENEPQFAAAEEWEAGVPRVQIALYADGDIDSFPLGDWPDGDGDIDWNGNGILEADDDVIDDVRLPVGIQLADVDNHPLGNFPGPEDVDHDSDNNFDLGDALNVTWTDSCDDSLPEGCGGSNSLDDLGVADDRCFDGLRNFNQVRPGVFDGGYAFNEYALTDLPAPIQATLNAFYSSRILAAGDTDAGIARLPAEWILPGDYIVQAATPPGFKDMREEDKNVDFGDEYIPSTQALPVACVGQERIVPPFMSITTKDGTGGSWINNDPNQGADETQLISAFDAADAAAPFAGDSRPYCDLKKVPLSSGQNAAAEFFLMTDVPFAGNISGVVLNDLANEFNPNSPAFGEKFAPPLVPIAFYDWNGKLVNRIYADNYGRYNLMVPSTFTANLPQPSGMSPNMLVSCMNDAGPIPDGNGGMMIDPFFDSQYSQFCYTFQYMPGAITYLDTPVEPIAAFTTPGAFPVDCERPDNTPMIRLVTRTDETGPYVLPGDSIRIESMGQNVDVPDPEWDGNAQNKKTTTRDYGFGSNPGDGMVVLQPLGGGSDIQIVPANNAWGQDEIDANIPGSVPPGDYQVIVVHDNGAASPNGVTLTVGNGTENVYHVSPAPYPATPIQDAIDLAAAGDLILVSPGNYEELVTMYKPVKLQGWGAGAVFLNARQVPTEKVLNWRTKVATLVANGDIDEIPGQELGVPGFAPLDEVLFPTEEGAAIFVAGVAEGPGSFAANPGSRVDGFTIVGASTGGGIIANGFNEGLTIGNNRLTANSGVFGGGIRIGHPTLTDLTEEAYADAENDNVRIHHNHVAKNGGRGGTGGGISLHTGADFYRVDNNWVCGNHSSGNGAGIGHLGASDGGLIEDNFVIFNESFAQAGPRSGGGIFVGGQTPLAGDPDPGTGAVTIDANIIRGNLAGAGDGGGISIANAGDDTVDVFNNMITNNVAGRAGGGIAIADATEVTVRFNTVANNDSTATVAEAFPAGSFDTTIPQPAGIMLRDADPVLSDNIVHQNRSFFWDNHDDPNTTIIEAGLYPATCATPPGSGPLCDVMDNNYDPADHSIDFGSTGVSTLDPQTSLLTDNAANAPYLGGGSTNITGDPDFINGYLNGGRGNLDLGEFTTLQTAGAFDEGGNFIQVDFGPLTLMDFASQQGQVIPLFDYHLSTEGQGSDAIGEASDVPALHPLSVDFDNDARPNGGDNDIGADEAE